VASSLDSSVYATAVINVYPSNIIGFADNTLLSYDGVNFIGK